MYVRCEQLVTAQSVQSVAGADATTSSATASTSAFTASASAPVTTAQHILTTKGTPISPSHATSPRSDHHHHHPHHSSSGSTKKGSSSGTASTSAASSSASRKSRRPPSAHPALASVGEAGPTSSWAAAAAAARSHALASRSVFQVYHGGVPSAYPPAPTPTTPCSTPGHVHERRRKEIYYFGLIDILQRYNARKKLEHGVKSIVYDRQQVSVQDPQTYARRFLTFMSQVIVTPKVQSVVTLANHGTAAAGPATAGASSAAAVPSAAAEGGQSRHVHMHDSLHRK
jgi:hypothetical protein